MIFKFRDSLEITVKNDDGLDYFINNILRYPNTHFTIRMKNIDNRYAYGDGVGRNFSKRIYDELISTKILTKNLQFIDINIEHDFWYSDNGIYIFAYILMFFVNYNYKIPDRLPIPFIEKLIEKTIEESDIECYFKMMFPDIYEKYNFNEISDSDFSNLELGYDNKFEYYKNMLYVDYSEIVNPFYTQIVEYMNKYLYHMYTFKDDDHMRVDKMFSGEYLITGEKVLNCVVLDSENESYQEVWKNFILSMDNKTLVGMLMTMGNTTSLNNKYRVSIDENGPDIDILTCCYSVKINKKFFDNPELLDFLKNYFLSVDEILVDSNPINFELDDDFPELDNDSIGSDDEFLPMEQRYLPFPRFHGNYVPYPNLYVGYFPIIAPSGGVNIGQIEQRMGRIYRNNDIPVQYRDHDSMYARSEQIIAPFMMEFHNHVNEQERVYEELVDSGYSDSYETTIIYYVYYDYHINNNINIATIFNRKEHNEYREFNLKSEILKNNFYHPTIEPP